MGTRRIMKMGSKSLCQPSEWVDQAELAEVGSIVLELRETMLAEKGVGIAAPQIGYNKRIMIFGFEHSERYPNQAPVPYTVLINPILSVISEEWEEGWEGCLSVPGLRGLVPRYKTIAYRGLDLQGNLVSGVAEGFHARMIQHENDHLEGILFPQRIRDLRFFGFEDTLYVEQGGWL